MLIIDAPHMYCAAIIDPKQDVIIRAAPIIKYMHGWTVERVEAYCASKGWICIRYE